MAKRLLTVFTSVILAAAIIAGAAYAVWGNISLKATASNPVSASVDDIAENYSFTENSKKFKPETYTMYLFPSTLYLQTYLDYLDGGGKKPEELYGYIEPVLDDTGAPKLDADENVLYSCSATRGDDDYLKDRVEGNGEYLSNNYENYYKNVYENGNWLSATGADSYEYGDPEYDKTSVSYSDYTTYDEQHNYRNLHRYDRFGYWPLVSKDSGRYLPLKIEVNENFSSNFYEQVVKRPLADMGDPVGWYCYSFSLWAYVAVEKNADGRATGNYTAPYFATDAFVDNLTSGNQKIYGNSDGSVNTALSSFCPTAVSQYFDLMGDISQYADADGIIRLFPKFSNGKTYSEYNSGTDDTGLPKGFRNGGSDGVRMTPEYKNSTSVFNQHDYYLSYSSELVSYNSVDSVAVASLPNVALADFKNLTVSVSLCNGSFANWITGWSMAVTLDESALTNIITSYGEGFYNLYLFLGNTGGSFNYSGDISGIVQELHDGAPNDTDSGKAAFFASLRGKNLVAYSTQSINKPVAFAIEKVRDARILIDVDGNNMREENLQNGYNSTRQYFKYISKDIFTVSAGVDKVADVSNPLNARYQYCYMLGGVDFTNCTTPYFQIRFQQRYRSDLSFRGLNGTSGTDDVAPDIDIIYNPKADGSFEKEQRFVSAFGNYFTAETKQVLGESGTNESQTVLKLKSEEYKGIYDLIIVYIPKEYYSQTVSGTTSISYTKPSGDYKTHSAGFYVFAYRQTNVFLKILANNTTTKQNGFTVHGGTFGEDNIRIFQKEYPLGVTVKGTDLNEQPSEFSDKYAGYTDKSQVNETLSHCLNKFVKQWLAAENKVSTVNYVVLRDHVTGAIVAWYERRSSSQLDSALLASGNYYYEESGNYYELVFGKFNVRKNYIFYVTTVNPDL